MVTTRNSDKDIFNTYCGARLLFDRLILILNNTGYPTSRYGCKLKYVHDNPACYNRCEKGTGAKCADYKKLEAKLMTNTDITEGGKSFVF